MRGFENRLAGIVEESAGKAFNGPLDQLKRSVDDGIKRSLSHSETQTSKHQDNNVAKDTEIKNLRAEVDRLTKENLELEKWGQKKRPPSRHCKCSAIMPRAKPRRRPKELKELVRSSRLSFGVK
ncbi:hypothetical protein ColLi_09563 [Colletotrichum liriopes]|uniref:Uncharacterized protein n=1 Tax=Colletotrichum liriopes TaxID=708192 RepID=A0AA37LVB5_9PEZI|nr:hypothetical protein ColLi_09563 [Colletotrichum liriopes]